MSRYDRTAVNRAIAASNRAGRPIGQAEARNIHRLLAGPQNPTESPAEAKTEKAGKENLEAGQKSPKQKSPGRAAGRGLGTPADAPEGAPGGEAAMDPATFIQRLAALGYNISTAHRLLGMGRSTIYRMSQGTAEVPAVVARLMDMYERHGIPEDHQRST